MPTSPSEAFIYRDLLEPDISSVIPGVYGIFPPKNGVVVFESVPGVPAPGGPEKPTDVPVPETSR